MAAKIVWTGQATEDYDTIRHYLISEFGEAAVTRFLTLLIRKLDLIAIHPHLFPTTTKRAGLRKAVIHKRLILGIQTAQGRNTAYIIV